MKLGDRKVRLLKELEINEISLVTSPANEGAKVMIWKKDHGVRELWEEYIDEVLSVHNKKLKERKANPPKNLSSDQVETLQLEKPWSRQQASQEARKTGFGQQLWAMLQQEAQPPISKGKHMFTNISEVAEAIKKGDLASQEDVLKELDELRDRDIAKSAFSKTKERAIYDQCTDPAWDSLYLAFGNLPKTVAEGEAFEKRQRASANIVKIIETLANELIKKDGKLTKAKAVVEVLDGNPAWKTAYEMVTYG